MIPEEGHEEDFPASPERLAGIAANLRAEEPIVRALREVGVQVASVSELINEPIDIRPGLSVLLEWLPKAGTPDIQMALARALTDPRARPIAARPLIQLYREWPEDDTARKWAIGNALSVVADDSVFTDIVDLVRDQRHGTARKMLAVALGNMRDPRAVDVLLELLADEVVAGHAIIGLGKLRAPSAEAAIEPFLDHPRAWIRREAKRALKRIREEGPTRRRGPSSS